MNFHETVTANALSSPYLYFKVSAVPGSVVNCQATSWEADEPVRIYWGDGDYTDLPGATLNTVSHTYGSMGDYLIAIECKVNGLERVGFHDSTVNIVSCNEAWSYHPGMTKVNFYNNVNSTLNLTSLPKVTTDLNYAFEYSSNAILPIKELPSGIITMMAAFKDCHKAILPFTDLPDTIVGNGAVNVLSGCSSAITKITKIPEGITDASGMFYKCSLMDIRIDRLPAGVTSIKQTFDKSAAKINLDELAENAPAGGYQALTNLHGAFYENLNVTGSRSRFLQTCPNAQDIEFAFTGTSTVE